ncbi:MAG: hypothetical protein D3910_11280, partial [Candidatus Electrothrix sp. ATG2]|nr:hypothetical protein [Candidatus Electrothrix sp. ATG2]
INLYAYVGSDPVNRIDLSGLFDDTITPALIGGAVKGLIALFGAKAAKETADAIKDRAKTDEKCDDDKPCNPQEGTRCYEGPDYGKPHGGLSPHYHIYEMQKKRSNNQCFWRYLGGKVGVGVVASPPAGMKQCSSYSNFTGRRGR